MTPIPTLPHFDTDQYGAVDFEGQYVPCAFGGEPGRFTAYILLEGVCQIIGIPTEGEITRILENHLLADGLGLVAFPVLSAEGQPLRSARPAISLMRLHTWLALIPPESVTSESMRQKLAATQQHFSDVVYAYFGRRILPPEIRAEDDAYLEPQRKQLYDALENAGQWDRRLNAVEEQVKELIVAISAGEGGDAITADQQEQLRAMMDILSSRYETKYGKGTRGRLINDIKTQHNFRFYNSVMKKSWPALVHDLIFRLRQLSPKGAPLPPVYRLAQDSVDQAALF